jgi:hypothetical protein
VLHSSVNAWGVEVGVRRSVAQIGEQLPAHDRKNARMGELVSKIASSFVAEGLAELISTGSARVLVGPSHRRARI